MRQIKRQTWVYAAGIASLFMLCLFIVYKNKNLIDNRLPPTPSLIPAVNDNELLDVSSNRLGCNHAYDLYGSHCHYFLYAKGAALWSRYELIYNSVYLKQFLEHYQASPGLHDNVGGQRLSHLFAVWSIARVLKPRFVIESGKYRGWGLYNVRQALGPNVILYSLDPIDRNDTYVDDNVNTHYFGGTRPNGTRAHFNNFTDVADVDWAALGVVAEETLVILDDHASVPRRVAELRDKGFRRFYVDDNAPRPAGDSLCPKYMADPRPPVAENNWKIPIYDTFGVLQYHVSYTDLLRMSAEFFSEVKNYYEFPPIVLHPAFFRERAKDFRTSSAQEIWELTAEPLLDIDDPMLQHLELEYGEINYYYCAYLEIK